MSQVVNHLLAHHLPVTENIPNELDFIVSVLDSARPIKALEAELGTGNTVSKRWTTRILSLLKPTVPTAVRTAGFVLLHHTLTSSPSTLLTSSKEILPLALNILESPKQQPELFVAALEVVRLIMANSAWIAGEWARETVGAAMVQRTIKACVKVANGSYEEIKLPALAAIVSLILLFSTPLRPIYSSLHDLSLALLCSPSSPPALVQSGASLIVSLYLIAKNGKDGLRDAWRLTLEGLVGSVDGLVNVVTSEIFAEDPLLNHTLSPFKLPPLDPSPLAALLRIEALTAAITLALRSPTSERTGPVEVPVGCIAELGIRLLSFNSDMPVKDRTDPTLLTLTMSLLPRLQLAGCQILAQLALATGARLSANASEILGIISRTLITYPLRSPMRAPLLSAYAIILQALGAALDPEEGKKSLARVWRCVLEDVGCIAAEPAMLPGGKEGEKNVNEMRKSKRQKTFDPTESLELAGRKIRVDEIDLKISQQGLATLQRLLLAPASHFLPPKLRLSSTRLLLALSLSPSLSTSQPTNSTNANPTYSGKTCVNKGIEIGFQSGEFRRGVLACLSVLVGDGSEGIAERAVGVWSRAAGDRDLEIVALSHASLSSLSNTIHPTLPPLQINSTFARQKAARVGGTTGDSQDLEEGADEFLAVEEIERDVDEMELQAEEVEEEEETKEEMPRKLDSKSFPSARGFASSSFGKISTPSAPISVEVVPVAAVAAASFIVAPVRPAVLKKAVPEIKKVAVAANATEPAEEDSDDEMPEIDMGSDDE